MCTCRSCKQTSKDVQRQVAQLIMLNGMVTDANQPGVEKLVATFLVPSWLLSPALDIDMEHGGAYLGPQKIFLVKGWTRAVCCLTVAYALMDCPELLQVGIGNMFLYIIYIFWNQELNRSSNHLSRMAFASQWQATPDEVKKWPGVTINSASGHFEMDHTFQPCFIWHHKVLFLSVCDTTATGEHQDGWHKSRTALQSMWKWLSCTWHHMSK